MNGMTIGEMLRACRGEWQGPEETLTKAPSSIVTDSRQAGEGSLFLALRGEKTDGHKYIPDVLQKGALAVLCEERGAAGEPRIVVPDTLAAMQQIAAASRKRWDIPFVGVTGSVGKTTAKEMLAAALSGKYEVFKTPGSMNGQIGIPVSLIGLHGEYDVAVIEMGVSLFGEMTRLTNMVHPDMAVFTNIGDAHLEALGTVPVSCGPSLRYCRVWGPMPSSSPTATTRSFPQRTSDGRPSSSVSVKTALSALRMFGTAARAFPAAFLQGNAAFP